MAAPSRTFTSNELGGYVEVSFSKQFRRSDYFPKYSFPLPDREGGVGGSHVGKSFPY